jgi:hypothetical protein
MLGLLTAGPARLVRGRAAAVPVGLLARLGWVEGFAIWPALDRPIVAVDLSTAAPAAWVRETFERPGGEAASQRLRSVRRHLDAATWNALRAKGLLIGERNGIAVRAVESALARSLDRPAVALYSPSGAPSSKANLFVFEAASAAPVALVMAMAQPAREMRLRREIEAIDAVRAQLEAVPDVADALPPGAIWSGRIQDRFAAVVPIDPMSASTGVEDRALALDWLRRFQSATSAEQREWAEGDSARELQVIEEAWSTLRPAAAPRALALATPLIDRLSGTRFRPCGVHGDYWRGNIATAGRSLRVYDWEWYRSRGHSLFDRWTYELAELRGVADRTRNCLEDDLAECLARVEGDATQAAPQDAVRALLMPVLAELAIRNRRQHGLPSPPESPYSRVMATAERLLER